MAELRWILLGDRRRADLHLWWWETRKARAPGQMPIPGEAWPVEACRHSLEQIARRDPPATRTSQRLPTRRPSSACASARRPPLIEIPDDLEVDVSDIRRHRPASSCGAGVQSSSPQPGAGAGRCGRRRSKGAYFRRRRSARRATIAAPWIRARSPLERDEVAPKPDDEPVEPPPADAIRRRTAEASKQPHRRSAPGSYRRRLESARSCCPHSKEKD